MNEHLNMMSANIERFSPVVNTGRAYNDGSRHHASANKEYFTAASSAQWQCGAGNFEIGRWVYLDTVSSQDLINKGAEYSLDVLTNKFRFGTYAGGSWTYVTANTFGALSANTWYFVRAWRDNTTTYGSEMLGNVGLETSGAGGADVFSYWGESASSGTVKKITSPIHGGTSALKLSAIPASGYPNVLSPNITVVPGHQYKLSVWSAGDGTHSGHGRIYDNSNHGVLYEMTDMGNTTTGYQLYEHTFTAPAGCTSICVYLFSPFYASAYACYDDISLVEVTAGTINISVNNGTADSVSATAPTAGSNGVVVGKGLAGYFNGRWDSQYVTHRLSTAGEATITYNSGNGQTGLLMSTANPTRFVDIDIWHDGNEAEGTAYDIIGTNHLTAAADPIIAPPVYGSELIVNGGFETAGGGGADVFGSWSESAGDGTIADGTGAGEFHSGAHAVKLTRGTNTQNISQTFNVTAGANYYLSIWSRGDGSNSGRYEIYDITNATTFVSNQPLNNPTTTYKLFTTQFTAPAGCSSVRIYLLNSTVNGAVTYFDDVGIKQIVTPSINNGGFDLRPATGGEKTNVSTVSRARTSNVATMVATAHGLKNNDVVTITGMTDTTFNGTGKAVTVVDVDTFTYASTGSDAGSAGDTGGRIATDVFSSWTEVTAGASMVVAGTTTPYAGAYNARIDVDASNSSAGISIASLIVGKRYTVTAKIKADATTGTPTVGSDAFSANQSFGTLSTSYQSLSITGTAVSTSLNIKNISATSRQLFIDTLTAVSLGPTSDAGIASGLALNTNGVSKVINDGWNAGSFAQITLAKRPLFSTAYFGGCLLFDGVDDGLVMTGDKIGVGDVTIAAVIRPTGWGGSNAGRIIDTSALQWYVDNVGRTVLINATVAASSANSSLALNTSYIALITRTSAGVVNVYINGLLNGTPNQNTAVPYAGGDTYIGNRAAGDRAFAGYIGKVCVINRILSLGEIQGVSRRLSIDAGGIY